MCEIKMFYMYMWHYNDVNNSVYIKIKLVLLNKWKIYVVLFVLLFFIPTFT